MGSEAAPSLRDACLRITLDAKSLYSNIRALSFYTLSRIRVLSFFFFFFFFYISAPFSSPFALPLQRLQPLILLFGLSSYYPHNVC